MEDEENETQQSTNQTSDRKNIKIAVNQRGSTADSSERYAYGYGFNLNAN